MLASSYCNSHGASGKFMDPQIAMHLKSTTNKRNHGTEDS
jgi:hypothetical protein